MPPAPAFRFSTDAVPPRDRLAMWREVIGHQYMPLDVEPADDADPSAEIDVYHLPSTLVSVLRTTPMRYARTPLQAHADGGDFTLVRGLRGGFTFSGEGEDAGFRAGDAALLANGRT